MANSKTFDLFLYYGGRFEEINGGEDGVDCYVGGYAIGRYGLDPDLFNFFDLKEAVEKLGVKNWSNLWYVSLKDNSREKITNDKEVMSMLSDLSFDERSADMFIEGGDISGVSEADHEFENVTTEVNENKVDPDEILIDNYCGSESEDEDYVPLGEESSDVSLGDLDSGDEEYIDSKRKLRKKNPVFDHIDDPEGEFTAVEHSGNVSEYESSDGNVNSDETDDDDDISRPRPKKNVYDLNCDHKTLEFQLGMRFESGWECRNALRTWAIEKGIRFKRVSDSQCEAYCKPPCKWKVYGSVVQATKTFMIKTVGKNHTCTRNMNNKLLGSKWITCRYLNVFRLRPNLSIQDLKDDIWERYSTRVGIDRLYKARAIAREMVRGTVDEHYGILRRYLAELRRVDKNGRYELLLGNEHVFKGLYIGHSALMKGFKRGCRPLIGLDGCHLKTYLGGILLCAVGKDENNQMFPIAWAVVEIENEECWSWFLKCLLTDLVIKDGEGWTFISDQQKGLENVVCSLASFADHRNCARHIYMNWKKFHKGATLKNIFWRAYLVLLVHSTLLKRAGLQIGSSISTAVIELCCVGF